jgi:hypothetical protein
MEMLEQYRYVCKFMAWCDDKIILIVLMFPTFLSVEF